MRTLKVIIVVGVEMHGEEVDAQYIKENMPDYVASMIKNGEANEAVTAVYNHTPQAYKVVADPTIYVSLDDFDQDRAERADVFANWESRLPPNFEKASRPVPDDVEIKASTQDWFKTDGLECLATAYLEYGHVCILGTGDWYHHTGDDIDADVPELLIALGLIESSTELD